MTRTGVNKDVISLKGTNGLTASSYTAYYTHTADWSGDKLFDGWSSWGETKLNPDAGNYIQYGGYTCNISKGCDVSNTPVIIDFGKLVEGISGIRLYNNTRYTSRMLKDFEVYTSNDNSNWKLEYSDTYSSSLSSEEFTFSPRISGQYIKILVKSSYGDVNYLQFPEIEILQSTFN